MHGGTGRRRGDFGRGAGPPRSRLLQWHDRLRQQPERDEPTDPPRIDRQNVIQRTHLPDIAPARSRRPRPRSAAHPGSGGRRQPMRPPPTRAPPARPSVRRSSRASIGRDTELGRAQQPESGGHRGDEPSQEPRRRHAAQSPHPAEQDRERALDRSVDERDHAHTQPIADNSRRRKQAVNQTVDDDPGGEQGVQAHPAEERLADPVPDKHRIEREHGARGRRPP